MRESSSATPAEAIAAYIGMDWADQKHDVILRSAAEPGKAEHFELTHEPDALMDWLGVLQQRFAQKGKCSSLEKMDTGLLVNERSLNGGSEDLHYVQGRNPA